MANLFGFRHCEDGQVSLHLLAGRILLQERTPPNKPSTRTHTHTHKSDVPLGGGGAEQTLQSAMSHLELNGGGRAQRQDLA